MKRKIILLFFMLSSMIVKGQNIKGIVLNAENGNPVADASIYYKGTLIQTTTTHTGEFNIPKLATKTVMVISCVGFYPSVLESITSDTILKVMMKPRIETLNEVVVAYDGLEKKVKIQIFKKEFLGTSTFAKQCIITNIDDLDFHYDKSTETLTATCDKALEIINPLLGYKLKYDLEKFIKSPDKVNIQGNYVFEELQSTKKPKRILKNREAVYKGSRMQFIRAISNNSLAKSGFKIYRPSSYIPINRDHLIIYNPAKQLTFLHLNGKIAIEHAGYVSFLQQNKSYSLIDETGFYDASLSWFGNMSIERMGDMLPHEFKSASETSKQQSDNENLANDTNETLVEEKKFFEKIYIHTNHNLFNSGDTLWFKTYLSSSNPIDTQFLSKKMYVDLVSLTSEKIVKSAIIYLDNGIGSGDFTLDDHLPSGEYLLRGYTHWMLNFADSAAFIKSIYVLPYHKEIIAKSINNIYTKTEKKAIEEIKLNFFPEGGRWIKGIETRFAVKAESKINKGIATAAIIFDHKGKKLGAFSTDSLGFGDFSLLCKDEGAYVVLTGDLSNKKYELPPFISSGPSLKVIDIDAFIQVQIKIPKQEIELSKQYFLLGTNTNGTCFQLAVKLNETLTSINIPEFSLPNGVLLLSLHDDEHTFGERLIFIREKNEIKDMLLQTDQQSYKQTDSVTVTIKTPYPRAKLSLSAFNSNTFLQSQHDISSQMIFSTLQKNKIENPQRYFNSLNPDRFYQLDLLLLTLSKSDFIIGDHRFNLIDTLYKPEKPITISGKVVNEITKQPLDKTNVSLSLKGSNKSVLIATQTDSVGRFKFENLFFTGTAAVRLTAMNSKGERMGMIELDSLKEVLNVAIQKSILQNLVNDTINLMLSSNLEKLAPRIKSIALKEVKVEAKKNVTLWNGVFTSFGKDQEFNLTKEDLQFKTLSWWMLNKVKGAMSSMEGDEAGVVFSGTDTMKYTVSNFISGEDRVLYRGTNKRLNPQFVVNGRDFFYEQEDVAKVYRNNFFETPLIKIKSVRVQHLVGSLIGETDNAQINNIMVDRYIIYLMIDELKGEKGILTDEVSGFSQPKPYYQNEIAGQNSNPSEIYWQPNITTDSNGEAKVKFCNLATTAKVEIQVQGLSLNGIPINLTNSYQSDK